MIHLNSLDNVLRECVVTASGAPSLCLRCIAALIHGSHDLKIAYTKCMNILLKRCIVINASNLQFNTSTYKFFRLNSEQPDVEFKIKIPRNYVIDFSIYYLLIHPKEKKM